MILAETFTTIREAFAYFLQEIYPNLSTEDKNKLKSTKHDFTTNRVFVSEERMETILRKYTDAEIEKKVKFS